jgi:signal transduction histidine kinase
MEGTGSRLTRSDWLMPVALALVGVAEVLVAEVLAADVLPLVPALASVLVPCAVLVGRRRFPLVCGTAATLAVVQTEHIGMPEDALTSPLLIIFAGCFALGRHEGTWWKGAAAVGLVDLSVHWGSGLTVPPLPDVLWVGGLTFLPWFFGRLVREHAQQNALLADQARQLVEEQRHVAERAVADERRRIARELHDVIAHSISVMVVQAGAARELLGRDEAAVGGSLDEIQRAGRAALGETGRLLGLLREPDETQVEPQPSAGDIARLVEDFRRAGLDVRLDMDGGIDGLPAGLDLSVFRIVEEGLTNALKHTPGACVRVRYRRTPDRVEVELASAAGGPPRLPPGGHGVIGMRERVAVFGGSLSAGPTADGGFLVSARLPLGETA